MKPVLIGTIYCRHLKCSGRIVAYFVATWVCVVLQCLAARAAELDVGLPNPHLYPSPDGKYLVCAQGFLHEFTFRGEKMPIGIIRVVVVDVGKQTLVGSKDFPAAQSRIAVGNEELYLLNYDTRRVTAYSLPKMIEGLHNETAGSPADYFVVADRLLCASTDVRRYDLPALVQSWIWSPQAIEIDSRFPAPMRPLLGGWLVGGTIFDHDVKQAQWVPGRQLIPRAQGIYNPDLNSDTTWIETANFPKLTAGESLGGIVHSAFPIAAEVTVPAAAGTTGDVPVTVRVKHIGGNLLDPISLGAIPAEAVTARSAKGFQWEPRLLPDSRFDPLGNTMNAGRGPATAVCWAGSRLCAVIGGRLSVRDFGLRKLRALSPPFHVRPQTPLIDVAYDRVNVVKPQIVNGVGPFRFTPLHHAELFEQGKDALKLSSDGTLSFHPKLFLDESMGRTADGRELERAMSSDAMIAEFVDRRNLLMQQLVGRTPRGIPVWFEFSFRVIDEGRKVNNTPAQVVYNFHVMSEIPHPVVESVARKFEEAMAKAEAFRQSRIQQDLEQRQSLEKATQKAVDESLKRTEQWRTELSTESSKTSVADWRLGVLIQLLRIGFLAILGIVAAIIVWFVRRRS